MIYLKSITPMSMDERVRQAVRDTSHYVEGSRRAPYRACVQPKVWKPLREHVREMDIHQNHDEFNHTHSWSLLIPQTASLDFKHVTLASSQIRLFPMDGLLFHVKEEHLFEFFANDYTDIITKKYN